MLVFYFGFYIQYGGLVPNTYLSGLLTWILFGLSIGIILSLRSHIALVRGVVGGLVARLVGPTMYIWGYWLFSSNFLSAKMIGMIVLGAVLGLVLVTVISTLENFELEFVKPKGFQNIPISKWLKNSQKILIGKEPGSYVYIKWDDPAVTAQHARLFYENGTVYIQPLAETLVNRKMIDINKKSSVEKPGSHPTGTT